MATTDRTEGYYWVVADDEGEWEPGLWIDDEWWLISRRRSTFNLIEVDERRLRHSDVSVTELCAALETALDLIAETLVRGWPTKGDKKMTELRTVLARARGEAVESDSA